MFKVKSSGWGISAYSSISEWSMVSSRLQQLEEKCEKTSADMERTRSARTDAPDGILGAKDATFSSPDGKILLQNFNLQIEKQCIVCVKSSFYLSIKYHILHPQYLFRRLKELGKSYTTRILILHVDMDDNIQALEEINKICFMNNLTLLLAWSSFEAARYLESIKALEKKGATSIKGKIDNDFLPTMNSCLTSIKSVNKTDVLTLLEAFKDFKGIAKAKEELLLLCPGIGETKVKALHKAFHTSFI